MTTYTTFILPLSASLLPLRPLPRRKDRLRICDQTDQVTCFLCAFNYRLSKQKEQLLTHCLIATRGRDVSMKEAAAILFHKLAMVITHIHLLCTKKSYVDVEGCTGTQVVLSRSSSKTAWLRAYAYYFISLPCLGAR